MSGEMHERFGRMRGWLERDEVYISSYISVDLEENEGNNSYIWKVRHAVRDRTHVKDGDKVDLSPDPLQASIPPPDRKLLLLHESVSKVLKMSGRGECFERFWRDYNDLKTLAMDGSSAKVLRLAIKYAQLQRTKEEEGEG
jgi:hypothetical protein